MKAKIIYGMLVLVLLAGCVNPYQAKFNENQLKINAYLIDSNNIGLLNDCTKLSSCDGWKCLCDFMASENNYCQRYENLCVNNICEDIIKTVDGVTFMEGDYSNEYSGCISVYDNNKMIIINGIAMENVDDETLACLSKYRTNQNVPDKNVYFYSYHNGRFFNEYDELIKC